MDLGLNWVDLIIILFLIFFALEALGRPLLLEVLDLLSFLLALIFSFRFYNYPAQFFEIQFDLPHGVSLVLGFIAVWFLTEAVFYLLVRIVLVKLPKVSLAFEKYLSVIPATLRGLVFIALILVLIATFPVQPAVKKAVNQSRIGLILLKKAYQLEQPVKQVFGGVSEESLTFLTIKPRSDERVNLGFQIVELTVDQLSENAMIEMVNGERVSQGLKALIFDATLQEVARFHSQDMFKRGYFSHYSPEGENVADRAEKFGIKYLVIGENLAFAPNLELAHRGLMNSEGHRANILSSDFGKIGIGVIDGGIYGKMFTQVFTN